MSHSLIPFCCRAIAKTKKDMRAKNETDKKKTNLICRFLIAIIIHISSTVFGCVWFCLLQFFNTRTRMNEKRFFLLIPSFLCVWCLGFAVLSLLLLLFLFLFLFLFIFLVFSYSRYPFRMPFILAFLWAHGRK